MRRSVLSDDMGKRRSCELEGSGVKCSQGKGAEGFVVIAAMLDKFLKDLYGERRHDVSRHGEKVVREDRMVQQQHREYSRIERRIQGRVPDIYVRLDTPHPRSRRYCNALYQCSNHRFNGGAYLSLERK